MANVAIRRLCWVQARPCSKPWTRSDVLNTGDLIPSPIPLPTFREVQRARNLQYPDIANLTCNKMKKCPNTKQKVILGHLFLLVLDMFKPICGKSYIMLLIYLF